MRRDATRKRGRGACSAPPVAGSERAPQQVEQVGLGHQQRVQELEEGLVHREQLGVGLVHPQLEAACLAHQLLEAVLVHLQLEVGAWTRL